MEGKILKLNWPIPDKFEAVTTNIDAVFAEWMVSHHSSNGSTLHQELRGNIVVESDGSPTHIYKVRVLRTSTIKFKEIELPKPANYEEIIANGDRLLADLLIAYYLSKKNFTVGQERGNVCQEVQSHDNDKCSH